MKLSPDELRERILRAGADAGVARDMAIASLTSAAQQATASAQLLGETLQELLDATVDAMTREQRAAYYALLECGTLPFDAAVEAEEMYPQGT